MAMGLHVYLELFLRADENVVVTRHVGSLGPLVLYLQRSRQGLGLPVCHTHHHDGGTVLQVDLLSWEIKQTQ